MLTLTSGVQDAANAAAQRREMIVFITNKDTVISEQRHTFNPELLRILILEGAEFFDDLGAGGGIWFVKSHMGANI